jgi:hypothetical protein
MRPTGSPRLIWSHVREGTFRSGRWGIALALLALAGCEEKKPGKGDPVPPAIEPMGEGESQVGREACNAYVAQVCGCVAKMPDLEDECEMSRARPNAFDMNTRAAMAQGDANTKDRRSLVANARKIMRSCIEDAAELAKKGCPMAPPPGSTTTGTTTAPPAAPAPATPAPATPAPAPAPAK